MLPIDKTYLKTNLINWKTAILDPAYIIQKETLPTASAQNLGKVFQYIGSNTDYTIGGFYQCQVVSGSDPVEYTWAEITSKTSIDNTTIKENSSKQIYVPKATDTTLGVVQAGDGIDVDANGVISVVARLEEIAELPTATSDLEGKIYLLIATQTGYDRGGIYMCEESTETAGTYEWKLISMSPLEAGKGITIEDDVISADTNIFFGTMDEWDALTEAEQAEYDCIATPDEAVEDIADAVIDGDMRAVTSNAVYEALQNIGPGKTLVPWAQASDSEVAAMINAYYNDELTLTEIQTVWHVGDIRTITLGSIGAIGVGESHRSQNVDIVILDFEHDDLTTAINGHTKALITVQLKDCLRDATVADDDSQNNTERGYMNDTNTNVGGWTDSKRRAWCNNYFYNAIPASMRTLIKPVNKLTSAGNQSATINTDSDKCFLVSEIEVFGSIKYSKTGEGNQYNYFETESNRYKLPKWNSSSSSDRWWERSPHGSNATRFCTVYNNGNATYSDASSARGLAPAWCL